MTFPLVGRPIPACGSSSREATTADTPGCRDWAADLAESEGGSIHSHYSTPSDLTIELFGGDDMQQPPIAETLHEGLNTFFHRFYAMTQDGIVTDDEQEEALDTLDALNTQAEYVAESQALGIAIARRGANSSMAVELTGRQRRKNRAA